MSRSGEKWSCSSFVHGATGEQLWQGLEGSLCILYASAARRCRTGLCDWACQGWHSPNADNEGYSHSWHLRVDRVAGLRVYFPIHFQYLSIFVSGLMTEAWKELLACARFRWGAFTRFPWFALRDAEPSLLSLICTILTQPCYVHSYHSCTFILFGKFQCNN